MRGFLLWGRTERPGLVLPRVGRDIGEDGHLVDVGVDFRVHAVELWVDGLVAGAGQAGESLVDLHKRIALVEVGVVILAGHPGRHGVGDLVGLGTKPSRWMKRRSGSV